MYDLIIVGSGPAGATLARLTSRKMRILILDKRNLDTQGSSRFEKCCGGLLAPDAQEMLAKFGLGLPKDVLVGPQLFTVRTIDFASGLERYYPRDYVNVEREAFDRWLVSLLPENVDVRWGARFRGIVNCPGGVEVRYSMPSGIETAKAKLAVGADGAFSRVRAVINPSRSPNLYVSVQEWFQVEKAYPYFSAIFDPEVTDFYAWTIPKGGSLLVGAAIPAGADVSGRFLLLKHKLTARGFILNKSIKKQGAYLLRPGNPGQICTGSANIALIGEAAGWISPSSAEGISYAFRSALAMTKALNQGTEGAVTRYARLTRTLKLNILGKIVKSPAMYQPLLRKAAMGSGLMSISIEN